jgi:hypothetical protein
MNPGLSVDSILPGFHRPQTAHIRSKPAVLSLPDGLPRGANISFSIHSTVLAQGLEFYICDLFQQEYRTAARL